MVASAAGGAGERRLDLLGSTIRVRPWLLDEVGRVVAEVAPAHTVAVITDAHVAPLHLPAVVGSLRHFLPGARVLFRAIPAGEAHKTRDTWAALTDWMLGERCGRDSTIVALGGGVVGDVAGFVAATFMRGIPVVQCPTSLLAMVDASVGGKVGVDTPAGKNLVGAFLQPHAVVVDPTVLQTLPAEHRRAGLAEVIKHGVIADPRYLEAAVALGPGLVADPAFPWDGAALADLVARSVEIKAAVVEQDVQDRGVRQVLNFGHTVGHALEAASGFSLLHGEAVAIGMAVEARLAEALGVAEAGTQRRIVAALEAVGLPFAPPPALTAGEVLARMQLDKKGRAGRLVCALPARIGHMAGEATRFGIAVEARAVEAALTGDG